MSPSQLAAYVRLKTKTDSTSFSDADMLTIVNVYKDEIANKINEANEDEFGIVVEFDLEVGKRNYPLDPEIMSKIKYFEVSFDGVNYKHLTKYDLNSLGIAGFTTNETEITAFMAGRQPGYFIFGTEIYLLNDEAIADVPNGLRMWIITFPTDIESLTYDTDMSVNPSETELGFPRTFHELLARRVIIDYKESQDKPIPLNEKELAYDRDLQVAINILTGKNLDSDFVAVIPDRSNNGQDY